MSTKRDVHLFLRAHFEETADPTLLDGQVDAILTLTAGRRQQPAWLASLRSFQMSTTARSLGRPMSAPAWALVFILALLIAIAAVGLTIGGWRLAPAPIVNGPIVFGRYDAAIDNTIIYTIRPDGSSARVLLPGPNECPKISPDGRRVAVAFGVVDIDGSDHRVFPKGPGDLNLGCGTWSPDGERLAVEGFLDTNRSLNGVFLIDSTDGGNPLRLTTNGIGGNDAPGDFSPDGSRVSFVRSIAGADRGTIWVAAIEDGTTHQVSTTVVDLGTAWSPDGEWIAATDRTKFIFSRPDGTDEHVLNVPADVGWVGGPSFSPDGQRLVFSMGVGTATTADIYSMEVDGTDLVQLTDTPNDNEYFTDWGIDPR
jgi:Tol biopolymer transport system component